MVDPARRGQLVATALQRLESLGLLDRDGERRCTVANPFFRRWLRDRPASSPGEPRDGSGSVPSRPDHSQELVTAIVERMVETERVPEELHEAPEVMAEAALALCSGSPAELTGRVAYSQTLLDELGRKAQPLD